MSAVADFQKQAEDVKAKEEESQSKSRPSSAKVLSKSIEEKAPVVLTEEDLAKWVKFQNIIRGRVGEPLYHTWIVCMGLEKVEPNGVTIRVPNMVVKQFIEKEIYVDVKEALKDAFGIDNVCLIYN